MKQYLSVIDESSFDENNTLKQWYCRVLVGEDAPDASSGKILHTFYEEDCEKAVDMIYYMNLDSSPEIVVSRYEYKFDPVNFVGWFRSAFKWLNREGEEHYRRFLKQCNVKSFQ